MKAGNEMMMFARKDQYQFVNANHKADKIPIIRNGVIDLSLLTCGIIMLSILYLPFNTIIFSSANSFKPSTSYSFNLS